jgi:predicted SnoaL-like aldol condensation-catalyzing enzyme
MGLCRHPRPVAGTLRYPPERYQYSGVRSRVFRPPRRPRGRCREPSAAPGGSRTDERERARRDPRAIHRAARRPRTGDRCLEEYSEDLPLHGAEADGLEELEAFYRAVREAIPDLTVAIERAIAEGDEVAVRYSWEGTHAATGEAISPESGLTRHRFGEGGIVERRVASGTGRGYATRSSPEPDGRPEGRRTARTRSGPWCLGAGGRDTNLFNRFRRRSCQRQSRWFRRY